MAIPSRSTSAVLGMLPRNNVSSQSHVSAKSGSHSHGVNEGPSSGSTVRKKDAQRLAEKRERLAGSLSGMSLNLSVHDDNASQRDSPSAKRQRAINLAHINNAFKSNASLYREANLGVDISSERILSNDVVPPVLPSTHELSIDGADGGGLNVGGGPGPAVPMRDGRRGGGESGSAVASVMWKDKDKDKDKDHICPTCLTRQSRKGSSSTGQPCNNMPSIKSIPSVAELCEEVRSPASTMVAPAVRTSPTSPRKVLRQTSVYTGI